MKEKKSNYRKFLLLPGLLLGATALAQDDNIVFELSPFNVQANESAAYETTNSQAATRMSVPLKDVPFNLQVVTEQFMEDVFAFGGQTHTFGGANREATSWMGSVEGKNVRGINSLEYLRNGFRRYSDNGSATIDRVEVIKGPNAILDGVTKPGGVINVVTKKPNPYRDFTKFKFLYGKPLDRMIANFDFNRRLSMRDDGKAFATFRLAGGLESGDYENQIGRRELENIMPSLTFNFTDNTLLGIQHEYYTVNGERQANQDVAFQNMINVPDPTGGNLPGQVPLVHYFNGNYEPNRLDEGISFTPTEINYATPEIVNDTLISVEHRFDQNVTVNVDYNYHNRKVHWGPLPNGAGPRQDEDGEWVWWTNHFRQVDRDQIVEGVRAQVAWHLDLGEQRHRFVAGYLTQYDTTDRVRDYWVDENGDRVSGNTYSLFEKDQMYHVPPFHGRGPWQDDDLAIFDWNSVYLSHHTKWFNDRLTTMIGIYDTDLTQTNIAWNRTSSDLPLGAESRRTGYNESDSMPQIGAIYSVNDMLGVYVNFSQSIDSNQGREDGFGNQFGPKQGEIHEVGAKFADPNGKISGTFSIYKITESNTIQFDETAPNQFNPTADPSIDPVGANVSVGETTYEGVDADFFFYPMAGWNIVFSYGYKDATISANLDPDAVGRRLNDFDHKASIFSKYKWSEGPLNGFSASGGVIWRSERQRTHNRGGAPAYIDARTALQAGVGYAWEDDKYKYRLNLAAKNLFKLDERNRGWVPGTRDAYYRELPAEYLMSFNVEY